MSGVVQALEFLDLVEGGLSDRDDDRGGRTFRGVTQANYNAWRIKHGHGTRDVVNMTDEERSAFYHEEYWVKAHCDAWWWPLSLAVFDAAVQHSSEWAIKLLQRAVDALDDGIVGPETRGKVADTRRMETLARLRWERLLYYARIVKNDPSQSVNIEGWINRMWALDRRMAEDVALAA